MTISKLIKEYRKNNHYSIRDFANKCGVSHSYIAMLENEKNSKTGEPIVPSLSALHKIAKGLSMNLNDLFTICDDMPVSLNDFGLKENSPEQNELSEGEKIWLSLYNRLSEEAREAIITTASALEQLPAESQKIFLSMLRGALGSQA